MTNIKKGDNMKRYGVLYKRNTNGSVNQWEIFTENNKFWTEEGLKGGVLTTSVPTVCEGKNIGRANETTPEQQSILEATAKMTKKIEKGYTKNVKDIDTSLKFFAPMLAVKWNDYKDKITFPVLGSPKLDGARLVAQANGLTTRNGKSYVSCPHISEVLAPLFLKHPSWKVDSEIYSHEVPFETIMSLVRKTKPTAEDLAESKRIVKIYIFDGMIDDINADFQTRFKTIKDEINKIIGKSKYIIFIENEVLNNHAEVETAHTKYVSQGYEGIMLRIIGSKYENKRSKNLLKLKNFFDEEYEIIEILEGQGNRSGMAGKIMCRMKDGKIFGAGIRGGEDYYKELLKNKNKYVGKKVTVRYQELSTDEKIPRFPVAVDIGRIDV